MRQLSPMAAIAATIATYGLFVPNAAEAVEVNFNSQTGNVYNYTLSLLADEALVEQDTIDFVNLSGVTNVALSPAGQPYFNAAPLDPEGTSASFTVKSLLSGATTLSDVFSLTSTAASGDINISVLASNIEPSVSNFITQGPTVAPTNNASALKVGFSSRTGNIYNYTLSIEANQELVPGDSIDFINLSEVTEVALSPAGELYFNATPLDPEGTSASFTVTDSLSGATTLSDVFSLTSTAASGDINISVLASNIQPSENNFITQGPSSVPTAVPFEFSPSLGIALGLPLFIGLKMLKKRRAIKSRITEFQ